MKELIKKLKSLYGLIGSISILLPGITFFLKYTPPLFDQVAVLTCALSVAFTWLGFKRTFNNRLKLVAIKYIVSGFMLAMVYLIILDFTSIRVYNSDNAVRYQIGWNLADWNLTDSAKGAIKSKKCTGESKEELLFCYTASQYNIGIIWQRWSIYLFGILDIMLFTTSFSIWSFGWGQLIKADK